jgi:hypothetical protein
MGTGSFPEWVGLRDGLDRCGKSRPSGIRPRTFQPIASRYTDYAIWTPTVVRSQSKIEANNLKKFSARIVVLYTELDVVHILVFAFLEYGQHQKYSVVFRSAVNSVVDQINCQRTTLPLHKQH